MTEKSRRDVLKYAGSSIVAPSLLAQSAAAKTPSDDFRKSPGEHRLPGNIHLVNNSQNTREITVKINRVTPGKQNPTVDEFKYVIDGRNGVETGESASNIVVDDTPVKIRCPHQVCSNSTSRLTTDGQGPFGSLIRVGELERTKG